jgi:hypothetical protein
MRCFTRAAVVALCAALAVVPLRAITYGFIDTVNAFPNAGAFIVQSPTTGQIFPICSGTLIRSGVFLTASHCTAFFEQELVARGFTAWVSFDSPIPFGGLTSRRTHLLPVVQVVTNPAYNPAQSDSGDIAVLLVDPQDTRGVPVALLPRQGLLDQLATTGGFNGLPITNVGYGVQNRVVGSGVPYFQDLNPIPRMFSFSTFNALNPGYIRYSQNPATGDGGTCFGDSGGPQFLTYNDVRLIVSITITGDSVCRATNVAYRLDTTSARSFLAPYVALP